MRTPIHPNSEYAFDDETDPACIRLQAFDGFANVR